MNDTLLPMRADDAFTALESDDPAARERAFAALVDGGKGFSGTFADALRRPLAHKSFGRVGLLIAALQVHQALPALFDLLDKGTLTLDDRALAARLLSELLSKKTSDPRAARHALTLSADPLPLTRLYAASALQALADPRCDDRLRAMAQTDPDIDVRKKAADSAPVLRSATPAPSLPPMTVPDGAVPIDFARLVADAGPAEVSPSQSTNPTEALVKLLSTPRWSDRQKVVEAVVLRGNAAAPYVIDSLLHGNAAAKLGSCLVCARLAIADAVNALLVCATSPPENDDEKELPSIALKALANCLTGQEVGIEPSLLPLTKHKDPFMRAGALLCLSRLPSPLTTKTAVIALHDPHEHVQKAAAVALSESVREDDTAIVPALILSLDKPRSAEADEAILIAFTRIVVDKDAQRVRIRHRLRRFILGRTATVRRLALTVLELTSSEHDPPPLGILSDVVSRLGDPHPEVRLLAAAVLARFVPAGMPGVAARAATLHAQSAERGETAVLSLLEDILVRVASSESAQLLQRIAPEKATFTVVDVPFASADDAAPARKKSSDVVDAKMASGSSAAPIASGEAPSLAGVAAARSLKRLVLADVVAVLEEAAPPSLLQELQLDERGVQALVGVTTPGLLSSAAAAAAVVAAVLDVKTNHSDRTAADKRLLLDSAFEQSLQDFRRRWGDDEQLRNALGDVDRAVLSGALSPDDGQRRRASLLV
jgi:hypothetical protein